MVFLLFAVEGKRKHLKPKPYYCSEKDEFLFMRTKLNHFKQKFNIIRAQRVEMTFVVLIFKINITHLLSLIVFSDLKELVVVVVVFIIITFFRFTQLVLSHCYPFSQFTHLHS